MCCFYFNFSGLEQSLEDPDENINVDIEDSSSESEFADYQSHVTSMQLNVGNSGMSEMFPKHNQRLASDLKSGFQTLKVGRKPRRRRTAFTHSQLEAYQIIIDTENIVISFSTNILLTISKVGIFGAKISMSKISVGC